MVEERHGFRQRHDTHADPDAQLAADVGDQLRQLVVGDLFDDDHVTVGQVDVDAGKVVPGVLPVGTVEVVLVNLALELVVLCVEHDLKSVSK